MGYGFIAEQIRRGAEDAGVPVIQNISLARALFERTEVDEVVPGDLFTAVAEVIVWARRMRDQAEATRRGGEAGPARAL
jgi:type III secretion protein U